MAETAIRHGYHDTIRTDVLPCIPSVAGTLIDVGGGIGATAAHLKLIGRAGRVGTIDLVAKDALPALDFHHSGDIEDQTFLADVILREGPFAAILCLDVLEHLVDPWRVISQLHGGLQPGGVIVVSIPNVRHFRVSFGLLVKGRWQLTESGIMDRTHLRFFVRDTAIQLMTHSGLILDHVESTQPTYRERLVKMFRRLTFGRFDTLMDIEYIIRVRREGGN